MGGFVGARALHQVVARGLLEGGGRVRWGTYVPPPDALERAVVEVEPTQPRVEVEPTHQRLGRREGWHTTTDGLQEPCWGPATLGGLSATYSRDPEMRKPGHKEFVGDHPEIQGASKTENSCYMYCEKVASCFAWDFDISCRKVLRTP